MQYFVMWRKKWVLWEKIKAMNTKFLRESVVIDFTRRWRLNYRDWKVSCVPGTKADDLIRSWQRIPLETV